MSQYLHFSIFLITVPNLIVIALMIVGFIIAVVLQLPHPPAAVPGDAGPPTHTSAAP